MTNDVDTANLQAAAAVAATGSLQSSAVGAEPGTTTVFVARHGQSVWSALGRYAGRQDVDLSVEGERQGISLAQRLAGQRLDVVLSSPLLRCRRTAGFVAETAGIPAADVEVDDDLIDGSLGDWTGCTGVQIAQNWPAEFERWRTDPDAAPPGGESYATVRERAVIALDRLLDKHSGQRIAVISHAAVVKMLLVNALDADLAAAYRLRIDTAALSVITVDTGGLAMVCSVNETAHLDNIAPPGP